MRELESLKNTNIDMDKKIRENSLNIKMTSRRIAEMEYNTNKLMKVHSKQISRLHELSNQKEELTYKLEIDIAENKLNENRIPELEIMIKEQEKKMTEAVALKEQYLADIEKEIEFRDDLKTRKADLNDFNLKMKSALKNEQ